MSVRVSEEDAIDTGVGGEDTYVNFGGVKEA